jgi:hypothetical protein
VTRAAMGSAAPTAPPWVGIGPPATRLPAYGGNRHTGATSRVDFGLEACRFGVGPGLDGLLNGPRGARPGLAGALPGPDRAEAAS